MLRDLGRRLGRGGSPPSAEPVEPVESPGAPRLDITAYTDVAILRGRLEFDGVDRLTDALNAADSFLLTEVSVEALADGATTHAPMLRVTRDELVAVAASGPRGDLSRRVRTQAHEVIIQSGPYELHGRVHALAGADPVSSLKRRRVMVPLTLAQVGVAIAGRPRSIAVDLLIVNRDLIDAIGASQDVPVAPRPLPPAAPLESPPPIESPPPTATATRGPAAGRRTPRARTR
jgi:hypothetical protein